MTTGRIDTHLHLVPPMYRRWLDDLGLGAGGVPTPDWSTAGALATMDEQHVAAGVLSVSTPGVHVGDGRDASAMARAVNEYAAEVVKEHPDRFGFFATLTLPDVDAALVEAAYALDELQADGIVLLANSQGRYLGDAAFDPLLAELDRRGAVVFVHPSTLPGPGVPGLPEYAADFLLDTTRAAANLARSGALDRFANVRYLLAHGGGFLPYAAYRMREVISLDQIRSFWFDTALTSSPAALPSLLAVADPGRITFGSDWPYAPRSFVSSFTRSLEAYPLHDAQRAAIDRGNAARLLPGLAARAVIA